MRIYAMYGEASLQIDVTAEEVLTLSLSEVTSCGVAMMKHTVLAVEYPDVDEGGFDDPDSDSVQATE